MKKSILALMFLLFSGIAFSQTTVTLQDQCNCEVLKGTDVSSPGAATPTGADLGDIYVNTNTGTIYFWDGNSWELTASDNQQLTGFTFNDVTNILSLSLEDGGNVNVDLSSLSDVFADSNTTVTSFDIDGTNTNLVITDSDANSYAVALADLAALINTDNQTLNEVLVQGNDAGGSAITNLADPTAAQDAATKAYVDSTADDDITGVSFNGGTNEVTVSEGATSFSADLSSLEESADIAANASDIATNTADITTNASNISTNTADIATNTTAIATNTTDIATNTADIATNTTDITTNASNISTNASDIATNTTDIATNASDIATNTAAISTNTTDITTNASNIATNTTDIANHIAADGDLSSTNEIQNIEEVLTDGNDANGLVLTGLGAPTAASDAATKAYVDSTADDDITGVSFNGGTNEVTVSEGATSFSADLSSLEESADIAANASDIATNTADITTNASNISTNTTDIATNTADIATNTTDITTNASNISTNTADIATNTTAIATNTTDIATNTTDIANHIAADGDLSSTNEIQNIEEVLTDGNDANGLVLTGLGAPTAASDAATKAYVDSTADDDITGVSFNGGTNEVTVSEGATSFSADLSSLEESADIAANATDIATNAADITTNASNISTNASDIATNTTDIATNASDIATNMADIATNTTDIATNASNISTNTTDIATNASDIATNTADITTNASNISTNTADIATNTTAIATNTTDISTNTTDIANHIAADGDLSSTNEIQNIEEVLTDGNDANGLVLTGLGAPTAASDAATKAYVDSTADDDITGVSFNGGTNEVTVSEGATSFSADLSSLEESADIAANTADIATNTTAIATNTTDIATNTTDIATNATDVATNTAAISTNTTDITTNASNISTNTADIATNTTAIATNTTDIATNTTDIANHIAADGDLSSTNEIQNIEEVLTDGNDANGLVLTGLGAPTAASDAATKAYVDSTADDDITGVSFNGGTNEVTVSEGATSFSADLSSLEESADIAANASDIATNTAAIATNTTDIANHIAADGDLSSTNEIQDAIDVPYDASTTTLTSTNVQNVIEELKSEVDAFAATSGQTNTASNVGSSGTGLFARKTGADLEFKNINAGSNKITITDDGANDEVDIDINEANLTVTSDLATHIAADGDLSSTNEIQNIEEVLTDGNDANGLVLTGLGAPTAASDAATKAYVDSMADDDITGVSFNGGTNEVTVSEGATSFSADLSSLEESADIAANASDIATNTAAISTNTTDIATNTTDIATNTADITTNASNISTNTADIATNTTAIATNTTDIATNTTDIANHIAADGDLSSTNEIQNIEEVLTDGNDANGLVLTGLGAPTAASDAATKAYVDSTADDDITGVSFNGGTNEVTVSEGATSFSADLSSLEESADIAANASDIATNTTAIATNTTDIATNTADIATNTTDITTNASNISTNTTDIANHIAADGDLSSTNEIQNIEEVLTDGNDANGLVLTGLGAPTAASDAATKAYVDSTADDDITGVSFNGGTNEVTVSEGATSFSADLSSLEESADIAANATDIATNTAAISTNTTDIATNTTDITTNASNISTNASDIATNTADIATNTTDIATNASDISTNTTDIATNTTDIANHIAADGDLSSTNEIQNIEEVLTDGNDANGLVLTGLGAPTAASDAATKAYVDSTADDDITGVSFNGGTNEVTVSEGATSFSADLSSLEESADIAANASDIATNAADITTNASNISTNTTDIATNTADITTNASNISTNTADIATNTTAIATNTTDISTNTTDIANHIAADGDLSSTNEIQNIEEVLTDGNDANGLVLTGLGAPTAASDAATKAYVDSTADDDITGVSFNGGTNEVTVSEGATSFSADLSSLEESADIAANATDIATNAADITTNASNISTNTTDIATNTADIATNTTDIATNTTAIATNTTDIATNTTDIATNTADIATNTTDIATNASNISTNTTDIATNTTDIATNTADIATNTTDIATNTTAIATNTTDIATNTTDIANHIAADGDLSSTNEIQNIEEVLTDGNDANGLVLTGLGAPTAASDAATKAYVDSTADDDITGVSFNGGTNEVTVSEGATSFSADLSSLEESADIAANASDIATNAADITTNASDISTNTADIATNTTDIATNTTAIATNTTDIATNTTDIATNTADIATNTTDIATNASNISTNTTDIATNTTDIATNASNIATNTADIATNTTAIATNTTDIANHIAADGDLSSTNEIQNIEEVLTDGNDANGLVLTGLGAPTAASDAATKAYVDSTADDDITGVSFNGGTNEVTVSEGATSFSADLSSLEESADIAANATDIATNTAAISTNTTDIATNTTDITTNASNISTNTADIATNTTDIATNTTAIATNTTDIATNTTDIANHIAADGDLSSTNEIQNIEEVLTDGNDANGLVLTGLGAPTAASDAATKAYVDSTADDDITGVSFNGGTNEVTVSEGATSFSADLSSLEESADIAANASDIATNTADIATNTTDIATNTTAIATNTTDIATNTTDIANHIAADGDLSSTNEIQNIEEVLTDGNDANGLVLTGLGAPTAASDAATKAYVDSTADDDITGVSFNGGTNEVTVSEGATSFSADLSSLEESADIAANASDIATNTTDIATNASNISTNTTDIATNASDIATNASNIATNTADIATNTTAIATNTTDIANHIAADGDLSSTNEIQNIEEVLTDGNDANGLVLTGLGAPTAASDAATKAYVDSTADDDITGVSFNGGTNEVTVSEGATSFSADLSSLEESADIAANATDIATNTAAISTNTTDIATNTTDITTNASNISTNTADIATNTTDIATNTTAIATNTTDIATNTTDIANHIAADGDLSSTNEINTRFEVNGTNLEIEDSNGTLQVPLTDINTDDQVASEVNSDAPIDVDGDGNTEATVEDVIQDIAPITSKAARIFYPPSIAIDASTNGTFSLDLYQEYIDQYGSPTIGSTGAPLAIPTYARTDLYYYVTYADPTVFDTGSMSIDANGNLSYTVQAQPSDYNALINVVFVVK